MRILILTTLLILNGCVTVAIEETEIKNKPMIAVSGELYLDDMCLDDI